MRGSTAIMAAMAIEHMTETKKDRVKMFFTPPQTPVYHRVLELLNEQWEMFPQGSPYPNPREQRRRCKGGSCRAPWTW